MAKFAYRMQSILDIKEKMEGQAKIAYGVANAKLMDEQGKLQQIMIRKAGYESQARNLVNGTIDVPKIKECKRAVDTMKTMQRSQMMNVHVAEKNVEAARLKLNEVMMERKTHERLKEQAFEVFKQEMQYAENKEKIPSGILKIEDYAFYGCVNLVCRMDDFIPETVEEIGNYAFANVTRMFIGEKFLDGNLRKIGNYAFANCRIEFEHRTVIGNKDLDIGEGAFENIKITTGTSLFGASDEYQDKIAHVIRAKRIGKNAFRKMSLEKVRANRLLIDDVEEIGDGAFSETSGCKLIMTTNSNLKKIGKNAFQNGKALADYSMKIIDAGTSWEEEYYTMERDFVTPNKLTVIDDYAFSCAFYSDPLSEYGSLLEVSEGIQRIGEGAFEKNKYIVRVNTPQTLKEIGEGAFEGCTNLKDVEIKENSAINKIGKNAFRNCPYLTSIVIPSSVTEIGDDAFDKEIITLQVEQGSYAALWASENGYSYQYSDAEEDTSWLNN